MQGTPAIVLTCADCGEKTEIASTRFTTGELPDDPLCAECTAFAERYTPEARLYPLGPPSDTDDDGTVWLRRTCPRCNGAGRIEPFRGVCFRCAGSRWTYVCPRNVNMVMKAAATFQANRIPRSQL